MSAGKRKVISRWFTQQSRDGVHLQEIERKDTELVLRAVRNGRTCFVYLDTSGRGQHHCTCQDWPWGEFVWSLNKGTSICRHIVAAALQEGQAALLLSALT